jgi:hypothetical protein
MPISIGFVDAAVFVRLAQSCSIRAETRIQVRKDSHRPGILAETVGFEPYLRASRRLANHTTCLTNWNKRA